ncbi:MAG: XTP/dITP diphosphatase [Actinobacteria bacterium]|nr:XTP/dITP diphosphatase [Actinomycetota bacterium]
MSKLRKILIATQNQGKLREIQSELAGLSAEFACLADLPSLAEVEEIHDTFRENADLKALYYADLTGLWTLADDSGLEVDALGGAPGVFSARYGGPDCDDARNNAKLLAELADVPDEKRTARFRCCLSLAADGKIIARSEGILHGRIAFSPQGHNGFGYDPLFYVPEHGCTTAQMSPEQKNAVSHRGQAIRAMKQIMLTEKLL